MLRVTVQTLKIISILTVAGLILLGSKAGFDYAMGRTADPRVGTQISFQVSQDDDANAVAQRLVDTKMIRSKTLFTTQMRLSSGNLVPGTYTLTHGMSVPDIISTITNDGSSTTAQNAQASPSATVATGQVTAVPGWRAEQDAQAFADGGLPGGTQAFMDATKQDYSQQFPFLSDRPQGASLEGYLFPDTYTVSNSTGAEDEVLAMLSNFDSEFSPDMRQRAQDMNLSIYQVLTIASIVEREAAVDSERPTIAAVYLNRLDAGMTLDADPTVQYVIGTSDKWWPTLEPGDPQKPGANSPYNTYINQGLPPGPICNPGKASINAVLNPDNVDYLYFVAKNDGSGEHAFATTLDEQQQNIDTYLNGNGSGGSTTDGGNTGTTGTGNNAADMPTPTDVPAP